MTSRRIAALLLSAAVTLGAGVSVASAATSEQKYQSTARSATNQQRVEHDLKRLRSQRCVQRYAVRQARIMAHQERMFHQDLGPILRECGLSRAGENVAFGFSSGRAVVEGWMGSEGHRANILDPSYRLLGLGARRGDDGRWYAAQVFGRK